MGSTSAFSAGGKPAPGRLGSWRSPLAVSLMLPVLCITADKPSRCKEDPRVVGECFEMHGRFSFANGISSLRIWRVRTQCMFGMKDDEEPIVPENIKQYPAPGGVDVFGDFLVCTSTLAKVGDMQMVRVENAEHLVVVRRC